MTSIYDDFFDFSNELYSLNMVKGEVYHHSIDGDKKIDQLLSFFFEIDLSKFEQHKALKQLIDVIGWGKSFADTNRDSNELTIAYNPSGIVICCGTFFNIYIRVNAKNFNDVIFTFYSVRIHLADVFNGFVYDFVYYEMLGYLNVKLKLKATFSDILKINEIHIDHVINKSIINDTVLFLDDVQFMDLYIESDSLSKSNVTGYTIKEIESIHYKVSEYFKYFISNSYLSELNSIFSLIIFYEQLIDPSFKMVDINVQKINHSNKFQEIYELYLIHFSYNSIRSIFKVVTGNQILTYESVDRYDGSLIEIEGIDNIYNHFKKLITDLISKTLDIQPTEIDNESILLYNMATL